MDSDLILILVIFAVLDTIVLSIVLRARRRRRESADVLGSISVPEWRSLPADDKHTVALFEGNTSGIDWRMRIAKGGEMKGTTWTTPEGALSEGIIAIGPHVPLATPDVELSHPMVRSAFTRMFGVDPANELVSARVAEAGGEEFRRRFTLFTDDPARAAQFLAGGAEEMLLEWGRTDEGAFPQIVVWRGGTQVKVNDVVEDVERLKLIATFGSYLAQRTGSITAWS